MDGLILHDHKQHIRVKSTAPLNRKSHAISKFKPKIRIIHIYAPEIIKTDAANFRELVQRLTGKPTPDIEEKKNTRSLKPKANNIKTKMRERIKGKEEIWTDADFGGGFLGDFTELDGIFMQDLHQSSCLETNTMESFRYA